MTITKDLEIGDILRFNPPQSDIRDVSTYWVPAIGKLFKVVEIKSGLARVCEAEDFEWKNKGRGPFGVYSDWFQKVSGNSLHFKELYSSP